MYYCFIEVYYKIGLICDFCYEVCIFFFKRLIGNLRMNFWIKIFLVIVIVVYDFV